jgi:glycerophosphoryl diester phosphodiesterase
MNDPRQPLLITVALVGMLTIPMLGASPVIIAHRGASGYLPEHTLEAKALAQAQGADFLEQDLVLTRDGEVIVLHDLYLDAVTDVRERFPGRQREDGRFYALDFTLAELRQLRVRERVRLEDGQPAFPRRVNPSARLFRLHTFAEEIEFIAGLNRTTGRTVGLCPEIKSPAWHRRQGRDLSRAVLAVLTRHAAAFPGNRVILQCFDPNEVRRLRQELHYAGRLLQLLTLEEANSWDATRLRELAAVADGLGPPLAAVVHWNEEGRPSVTPLTGRARAAGLEIIPYTLRADSLPAGAPSEKSVLEALFHEVRVAGVFTDFPDRAVLFRGPGETR